MPKVCAVRTCKTGTVGLEEKRSLFRVPMNKEQKKKWEAAIPGNSELKLTQSICEKHFLAKDVHKKWVKYDKGGSVIAEYEYPRPRLSVKAIPCIFKDEIRLGSVHSWTICKQGKDGIVTGSVLANSNANILNENEKKPKTIQAIYFTGEHSYCRMESTADAGAGCKDTNEKNLRTIKQSSNDSPSPLKTSITKLPEKVEIQTTALLEVDVLMDSLMDCKSPEETVTSSEKSQRITLTTPNGKTQATVKSFTKPAQIRLMDSPVPLQKNKTETSVDGAKTVKTEGDETANTDDRKEKTSQLQFDTGGVIENGNKLVKLPYTWALSELITHEGKQIIFSHMIMVPHHNFGSPVLKKSVVIDDNTGRISYHAHGRPVNISKTKLPQRVEDIISLQITLYTFQKMRLCGGVAPVVKARDSTHKDIYQDLLQCWRHNNCPILVDRGKCEQCSKLQKTLSQKRRRAEKSTVSVRMSSSWDPRDQIIMLKKKLDIERKMRLHAQNRSVKLTGASKENGVKVTFVDKVTL